MHATMTPGPTIMGRLAKGDDLLAALTAISQARAITLGEVRATITRRPLSLWRGSPHRKPSPSISRLQEPGYFRIIAATWPGP